MADLYHRHGVRIFNFQDDNFFLPNPAKAAERFAAVRDCLWREGVRDIAIAVKARPDSITEDPSGFWIELGLFRVFLGVENASENGLRNLNRKNTVAQILNALRILNDFDVHIAYNLLMFEPDTSLDEILVNLRFMERHIENPFNFCRAEAYAGTGLETKLLRRRAAARRRFRLRLPSEGSAARRLSTRSPTTHSSTGISATSACITSTCRWISTSSCCVASTPIR